MNRPAILLVFVANVICWICANFAFAKLGHVDAPIKSIVDSVINKCGKTCDDCFTPDRIKLKGALFEIINRPTPIVDIYYVQVGQSHTGPALADGTFQTWDTVPGSPFNYTLALKPGAYSGHIRVTIAENEAVQLPPYPACANNAYPPNTCDYMDTYAALAHELGHVYAIMTGQEFSSVEYTTYVRKLNNERIATVFSNSYRRSSAGSNGGGNVCQLTQHPGDNLCFGPSAQILCETNNSGQSCTYYGSQSSSYYAYPINYQTCPGVSLACSHCGGDYF